MTAVYPEDPGKPRQVEPRLPAGVPHFPAHRKESRMSLSPRTYILGACLLIVGIAWVIALTGKGDNR
jgi:hypothetical protein